jgi:hypothetical protein
MSDLPDLDTSQVGVVAYWNAKSQGGVNQIDPLEPANDGWVNSYTAYDNGIEGTLTAMVEGRSQRDMKFRVKTDGWMLVWVDQTDTDFRYSDEEYGVGYRILADVIRWSYWEWDAGNWPGEPDAQANLAATALDNLRDNFSNSGTMTFNFSDVGLYSYKHPDATTMAVLTDHLEGRDGKSMSVGFQYDNVTRYYEKLLAACEDGNTGAGGYVTLAGVELVSTGSNEYGVKEYGAWDSIANGDTQDAGTEYTGTINPADYSPSTGTVMALWG